MFYYKFQILDRLHCEYYNDNNYAFANKQLVLKSALYCSRPCHRWCWYIFEFLCDSFKTGILRTSFFKAFLLLLERWYLASYFWGFLSLFYEKMLYGKFQILPHSISNIIITITHFSTNSCFFILRYNVRDIVRDGADLFLNFFVIVLQLEFSAPLDSFIQTFPPFFTDLVFCFIFFGILFLWIDAVL